MSLKEIYHLTPDEIAILQRAKETQNINLVPGYFFRRQGQKVGWQFDANFTERGKWQEAFVLRAQSFAAVVSGIGTGKTLCVGMGGTALGMLNSDYKFLNIAQKAWQAQIMYNLILDQARNTLMDKIIYERPRRPHPRIVLRFYVGAHLHESTLEFMSADKDATGILSWRGDEINIEEAGLFNNLDEIITNLSTRLTGTTATGREYMGRLSLISNPWEDPYLWYLFDLASTNPIDNLSLALATADNKNISDRQLKNLLSKIDPEDQARFLLGARPEGRGNYFSKEFISKCEDPFKGELVANSVKLGLGGYIWERMPGAGVYHYMTPPQRDRIYFVIGDPGTDAAPARNAPVVMVWDVTEFPANPAELVAFWWGNGHHAIEPFTNKLFTWMGATEGITGYSSLLTGIDSTGPQKYFAETLNNQFFAESKGMQRITPLDFSGPKKRGYLVTLRVFIETGLLRWPEAINGIRSQLKNYEPEYDTGLMPRLPQDIVATMAMSAWVMRRYFNVDITTLQKDKAEIDAKVEVPDPRGAREKRGERERRSGDSRR